MNKRRGDTFVATGVKCYLEKSHCEKSKQQNLGGGGDVRMAGGEPDEDPAARGRGAHRDHS